MGDQAPPLGSASPTQTPLRPTLAIGTTKTERVNTDEVGANDNAEPLTPSRKKSLQSPMVKIGKPKNVEWTHWTKDECVLSWCLSKQTQESIDPGQLRNIHSEILALMEIVGAESLSTSPMFGLICKQSDAVHTVEQSVSREDTLIRLGQLLCRWAAEQSPPIGLRIGVDTGELKALSLPSTADKLSYYGSACQRAYLLAESAPKDLCVHLFPETRAKLRVFERMRFTFWMNPRVDQECCYLDPWEEAVEQNQEPGDDDASSKGKSKPLGGSALTRHIAMSRTSSMSETSQAIMKMNVAEFGKWLEEHGVDTSKFGRGQAKSVSFYHKEIVELKKSYIAMKNGRLHRVLELARINLIAKDEFGTDNILQISMEVLEDGRTRARNQKLGFSMPDGIEWRDAVRIGLQYEFNLDLQVIDNVLVEEGYWFKEQGGSVSASVPGIPTIYLTHEIRLRVTNKENAELQKIGLPEMSCFTTGAEGGACKSWTWLPSGMETSNADTLQDLLVHHGINVQEFETGVFEELLEEVYEAKDSHLLVRNGELLRSLQIVKVWILTEIVSVPHILVSTQKVQRGKVSSEKNKPVVGKMKNMQSWEEAVATALLNRLGLEDDLQKRLIHTHDDSYKLSEEIEYSRSYPGLKTVYRIHEVTCTVLEPHKLLGLPGGSDVCYTRARTDKHGNMTDVQVNFYSWKPQDDVHGSWKRGNFTKGMLDGQGAKKKVQVDPKRRLPGPTPLPLPQERTHACVVHDLMSSRRTDWERARNAARRIRDKDYLAGDFYDDCMAAFPELSLYVVKADEDGEGPGTTSSGRTTDDEFQRTIGALFAVYWLMRLPTDGAQSFAFGVGDDWLPLTYDSTKPSRSEEERKKRSAFVEQVNWGLFEETLIAAGLLKDGGGHDEERTLAMLALTAIHDIMKIEAILPVVSDGSGAYAGCNVGDTISDHDVALGYILEFYPEALPSYAGLPERQRHSVKFTQCNMAYNMGWLVQAEAPPGALFGKFKEVIDAGEARPEDIAFYFTHWLTDLAGAEPYPQEGCEKFVLKFPQKVLQSFVKSFPVVKNLATASETKVLDDYLEWRWKEHEPDLGMVPSGPGSVAKMRLVVMAQGNSPRVLSAYAALSAEDREVLDQELAITGRAGQRHDRDPLEDAHGPALLVYYAPALMQKNVATDAEGALRVLAEVLRQGRHLWPLEEEAAGETITLQIHALKDLEVHAMKALQAGEFWTLSRNSSVNALVQKTNLIDSDGHQQVLDNHTRICTFFGSRPHGIFPGTREIKCNKCMNELTESECEYGLGLCNPCFDKHCAMRVSKDPTSVTPEHADRLDQDKDGRLIIPKKMRRASYS